MNRNLDTKIDYFQFLASMNSHQLDLIDYSRTTPEQKERIKKIIEDICTRADFDLSKLPDEQLKFFCRTVQINTIRENLDKVTDKVRAYYTLADLSLENKLLANAENYYRQAIMLKPDLAELYNDLAVSIHLQGRLREAVTNYDKALELKPDYPAAQDNRRKALSALNKVRHD